jgi:hypothetical protein
VNNLKVGKHKTSIFKWRYFKINFKIFVLVVKSKITKEKRIVEEGIFTLD